MNKKSRNNLTDSIRAQIIDMPSTQPITSVHIIPHDPPTLQAGTLMEALKVKRTENEKYRKFYVADNGRGAEEKYFKKIFELLETLHSCDETDRIGPELSLLRKIVEMYEGQIRETSRLDYGNISFFSLPKKALPAANNNKHLSNIVG